MHKKRLWTQFIGWSRTIHIYLTMMGLLAMVLFGATGYTINHEDWFGATHPVVVEFQGSIAKDPVTKGDRLAQGIVLPAPRVTWDEVSDIRAGARGGFGATGR